MGKKDTFWEVTLSCCQAGVPGGPMNLQLSGQPLPNWLAILLGSFSHFSIWAETEGLAPIHPAGFRAQGTAPSLAPLTTAPILGGMQHDLRSLLCGWIPSRPGPSFSGILVEPRPPFLGRFSSPTLVLQGVSCVPANRNLSGTL